MEPNDVYLATTETVVAGAAQVLVDIAGGLQTSGRRTLEGPAQWLYIKSDKAIAIRFNAAANDPFTLAAAGELTIPPGALRIRSIYLATTGGCGTGNATVKIIAS